MTPFNVWAARMGGSLHRWVPGSWRARPARIRHVRVPGLHDLRAQEAQEWLDLRHGLKGACEGSAHHLQPGPSWYGDVSTDLARWRICECRSGSELASNGTTCILPQCRLGMDILDCTACLASSPTEWTTCQRNRENNPDKTACQCPGLRPGGCLGLSLAGK